MGSEAKFLEYVGRARKLLVEAGDEYKSIEERRGILEQIDGILQEAEAEAQLLEQPPIVQLRLFRDEMLRMIQEFDEFEKKHGEEGLEE